MNALREKFKRAARPPYNKLKRICTFNTFVIIATKIQLLNGNVAKVLKYHRSSSSHFSTSKIGVFISLLFCTRSLNSIQFIYFSPQTSQNKVST